MGRILLLGAGFSRNWGGLLASEMFETLLQQPEISDDHHLRRVLWDHGDSGGFENALGQVQQDFRDNPSTPLYKQRLDKFPAYQPIGPLRVDGPAGEAGGARGSAA